MKPHARYRQDSEGYLKRLIDEANVALIDDKDKQIFIDLLRDTDRPLHPQTRLIIAAMVQAFLFPETQSKRELEKHHHMVEASILSGMIKYLTQKYKAQGVPNPVTMATDEVAAIGRMTVDTMKKRIKRARPTMTKYIQQYKALGALSVAATNAPEKRTKLLRSKKRQKHL